MKKLLFFLILLPIFFSCGGGDEFKKNPVDNLIRDMNKEPTFTIVLYDMDVEGTFARTFKHQYQIITERDSEPVEKITPWMDVNDNFYRLHENDMGMEIASKTSDGKVHKQVAPAGFSNYVGNTHYGHWSNNSSGDSFWEFYGKYAMMSNLIGLATTPIRMSYYSDYHTHYWGSGRSYYGPSDSYGRSTWGSSSAHVEATKPTSAFKSRVNSKISRSAPRSTSGSSGSSFRSRGGGGGK